jgi:glycosyltransferase involved in cell wall biosynthesis
MKQRMKILYFSYCIPKPNLPEGTFTYNRIKELVNQKIEIVPVTTSNLFSTYLSQNNLFLILKYWGRKYNFRDIDLELDLDITNLKKIEYPKYYFNLLFFNNVKQIKKKYLSNKCNLVHAHYIRDGIYAYWLKKKYGIPYIVTAHAYDIHTVPMRNKYLLSMTLKVLENSEKSIFVSEMILEIAKKFGYSGKNAVIIRNGYDPDNFYYMPENNNAKKEIVIGFVGDLIKRKRADYLPEILHYVKKRIGRVKLYIIGQGVLKNKIITKLEKYNLLNDVLFYGHLDHKELGKVWNEMDVLLLPSIHEGFSTVIVESLACGVPVVASDAEGNKEAVQNCGTIVSQGDNFIERFSDAIIRVIENPISKDIILKTAKNYTWEDIVKKEIKVYQEALKSF